MATVLAKLTIETPEEMHELGLRLAAVFQAGDLILLTGPLGAGKTTLTRGIGEALGAIGNVSSPTFVLARTHSCGEGRPALVHVDAYRLSSAAELDDLDIDFPNSITIVEWGKGLTDGITDDWLEIEIERDHTGESEVRELVLTGYGERWAGVSI
ncbi:tRNA (adenosine(37)-N6)-threonylcarbamoyltransferase complex ATPase subunit type 1 TsaE [Rhodoluna limnophila]|jgi:tRNA threonylcarbamoyladenosine biosynthesis protein TsaE|uniref:tRNA (adenosine(37)-N6)-threonylcarbamoyltransferase complex ATPase subunit type 1 TsaE n=1 Tax=Rhodoluna limnophila TaxID=232537 RepID=UPI001105E60D|nr:tRNA (adenosine(37)-N6)-threonylcarbamoyltransferase complex ATPase subunit type 1 TsaE [Rhodoluna limnophila]